MDPNENTPSEIYRNIRDKALEEAAELADKRPYGFTDLSRQIRALKENATPQGLTAPGSPSAAMPDPLLESASSK